MVNRLNDIEKQVLSAALSRGGLNCQGLRCQIDYLQVRARDLTGVGFVTTLMVVDDQLKSPVRDQEMSGVFGQSSNLQHGFGCVVFVREGQIQRIECATFDEPWPDDLGTVTIRNRA